MSEITEVEAVEVQDAVHALEVYYIPVARSSIGGLWFGISGGQDHRDREKVLTDTKTYWGEKGYEIKLVKVML